MPLSLEEELEYEMELARAAKVKQETLAQNLETEVGQRSAILPGAPTDGPKGEETVQLQPASPTMFEGVDPQSEQRMREEYNRSPDTSTGFGGFQKYKGQNIPPYDPYNRLGTPETNQQAVIERHTAIPGGIANAVRNAGQLATGIAEKVGIAPHGSTESYSKNVPKYEPQTARGGFLTGVTEVGAGMVAGGGPIGAVAKGATGALRIFKNAAKYAGAVGGSVATVDEDVAPLFTGPSAEFGNVLGNLALDEKGNFNQKYLENRMNLFIEAYVMAKGAEAGVRSGKAVGKFLWDTTITNWKNWRSIPAKQRQYTLDIFTELAKHNPLDTAEQVNAQKLRLAQRMKEGAFAEVPSDVPGIDPVKRQRSTMEAVVSKPDPSMTPKEQSGEFAKTSGLQTDTLSKGASRLETVIDEPARELGRVTEQTRKTFGGAHAVERGRDAILKDAEQEVGTYSKRADKLQTQLDNSNKNVRDLQEEIIPPEARTGDIDLGLRQKSNQATDEIVTQHNQKKGDIVAQNNRNFDEVRESKVPAAMDEFNAVRAEVDEYIPDDIKKLIDDSDGTYGYLKKNVEPELSAEINDLYSFGKRLDKKKADALKKLRDNIRRDQKAALVERGEGIVTAGLADEADEFHRRRVAPLRQGLSEDLTKIEKENRLKPDDLIEKSRAAAKSVFKNPDRDLSSKRVLDLVDDDKLKSDFVTYNIAEEISDEIATKGVKDLDVNRLTKVIRTYQPLLGEKGSKRLEQLLNSVNTKSKNIDELSKIVDGLKKETEAARTRIYDKELKNFYDDFGDPIKNADEIFIRYLDDEKNAIGGINKLSARLKNQEGKDALLGDAFKSAYAKFAQKKLFGAETTGSGTKRVNTPFIAKESEKFLEIGDKIYGKDHTVMKMYRALMDEALLSESVKTGKKITTAPLNQADVEAKKGVDFVITQIFGPLSRWGARLRSGASNVLSGKSSKQISIDARDFVMANPEAAAKILEDEVARASGELSKEAKIDVYRFLILNGVLARDDVREEDFVEDVFGNPISTQTDKALRGSVDGKK